MTRHPRPANPLTPFWYARSFLAVACVSLLTLAELIGAPALQAQEASEISTPPDVEAIIEQILELRDQLDALLATLPPELREEVERQWKTRLEAKERSETPQVSPSVPDEFEAESAELPSAPEEPDLLGREARETTELVDQIDPESPASPPEPEPAAVQTCVHLAAFDTNDDGVVSAGDRYWRYLRLWTDNGNGTVDEELEIKSLFALEIQEIRIELDYYGLPNNVSGDIRVGDDLQLVIVDPKRNSTSYATLVVQAGRMARGGNIWLADHSGQVLSGYQTVGPAIIAETQDGKRLPLVCP